MLDNTKFRIVEKTVISKLLLHSDFVPIPSRVNSILKFKHKLIGSKFRFELAKEFHNGQFVGYKYLDLCISPHYHFNAYKHNGNDFTPLDCINVLCEILNGLKIQNSDFQHFNIVNLEFGLNILPDTDIKNLINGIMFSNKTPFVVKDFPFNKITDSTDYKRLKAYAKGLQFADYPKFGINRNTFRFEVKTKQAKQIKNYGINTVLDLLNIETYQRLAQTILKEFDSILIVNFEPDFKDLDHDAIQFIHRASKVEFWRDIIATKHRNTFQQNRGKYYEILRGKNNLHQHIKTKIIDKVFYFLKCANSTQKTPINRGKVKTGKNLSKLINVENAHLHQCIVTGLDISMQRKGSKFLCYSGLRFYQKNRPDIYLELKKKYLTNEKRNTDLKTQNYYLAHNIRNAKTNPIHNRKTFENRHYNPSQLQFNF